MKKILLHGATNCDSSNFGDYLYADMVIQYLEEKGLDYELFQPSEYFEKYLDIKRATFGRRKKYDALVYIPGGYFGEGSNATWKDNLIKVLRYFPIGLWTIARKKPIFALSVGSGATKSAVLRWVLRKICNYADAVTVRDRHSYAILRDLCADAEIVECGDLIITRPIRQVAVPEEIIELSGSKKILLVHFNHDMTALQIFADSVREFVKLNPDYHVVVSSDCLLEDEEEYYEAFQALVQAECTHYRYNNPYEFAGVLSCATLVLTCKLHAGVVASSMEKSVVIGACHYDKTRRFYEQLGEDGRCVDLYKTTATEVLSLLEMYKSSPIHISDAVFEDANRVWPIFDAFLERC